MRPPNVSKLQVPHCVRPQCSAVNYAIGLCRPHYQEDLLANPRRPPGPCAVDGCDLAAGTRGLCGGHYSISWKYGLTPVQIAELINGKDGICPICRVVVIATGRNTGWHIDHDHTCCPSGGSCGKCVRDAVCARCNMLLGNADDSPETLRRAADYLEKWNHA